MEGLVRHYRSIVAVVTIHTTETFTAAMVGRCRDFRGDCMTLASSLIFMHLRVSVVSSHWVPGPITPINL